MTNEQLVSVLRELDTAFMLMSFQEGRRSGAMKEGHYDRQSNIAFVLMYCGAGADL